MAEHPRLDDLVRLTPVARHVTSRIFAGNFWYVRVVRQLKEEIGGQFSL
jgi:hypothetical protein